MGAISTANFQPNSSQGFEELLSSTNGLNRKLEEVLEMTREYETIAALWRSFYELMSGPKPESSMDEEQLPGLPGTGGHTLVLKQESKN
jgi:DASH complex subunit DAD1